MAPHLKDKEIDLMQEWGWRVVARTSAQGGSRLEHATKHTDIESNCADTEL